jgi:hypothetical protein
VFGEINMKYQKSLAPHIEHVLTDEEKNSHFRPVYCFGNGEFKTHEGREESLWMTIGGAFLVKSATGERSMTMGDSVQWFANMFSEEIPDGSWDAEMMMEFFSLVASELKD